MILRSPLKRIFPHLHSSLPNGEGGTRSTFGFSGHVQASVHTQCPQNTTLFLKHQRDLWKMSVEDFFLTGLKDQQDFLQYSHCPLLPTVISQVLLSSVNSELDVSWSNGSNITSDMIFLKTFSFFDKHGLWSCEIHPVDAAVLKTIWTELAYQRVGKIFLVSLIQIKEMQKLR